MIHHVVLDGVSEGALGVGVDIVATAQRLIDAGLHRKSAASGALRQRVVSLHARTVRSSTGRPIAVDGVLSARSVRDGDVIVLPGISGAATERAVLALIADPPTQRALSTLTKCAQKCAWIGASCSATFVLGAAGLLSGQSATTTWWLAAAFSKAFSDVQLSPERMVVESDRVLTAGSAFAHADLVLAVLARTASPTLAHLVTRYLLLDERPSQARYMVLHHLRAADPALRKLERFVLTNIARQLELDELARAAGLSSRTLARRVRDALATTPQAFVQRLRVERAAHLLETTTSSVEHIAESVGYADAAAFRRVFRRLTGASPKQARDVRAERYRDATMSLAR